MVDKKQPPASQPAPTAKIEEKPEDYQVELLHEDIAEEDQKGKKEKKGRRQ